MDTRPVLDASAGPFALCASFNDDNTYFSVALETGFRVFSCKNAEQVKAREIGGGIGCAEMLSDTRYIALVGGGKQPKFPYNKVCPEDPDYVFVNAYRYKVQIWNDDTQKVTVGLEFKTQVQRVRISQLHLIVAMLNSVAIYRMKIPPEKIGQYETYDNLYGLCCLGKGIVACPGIGVGQVRLIHLDGGKPTVSFFTAHNSPLRALALSPKGNMVATASEQGTLIRIFSVPSCTKIMEFRRGVDPAIILSLSFSPSGSMLAAASDKSTLHIFDLATPGAAQASEPDPKTYKWGILSKVPLLPRQFSDQYSSATAKLELGDEPVGGPTSRSATLNAGIPGVPGGRPTKGLIGWLDESTLIHVGAGQEARWEIFRVTQDESGRRIVYREGWKKYLE